MFRFGPLMIKNFIKTLLYGFGHAFKGAVVFHTRIARRGVQRRTCRMHGGQRLRTLGKGPRPSHRELPERPVDVDHHAVLTQSAHVLRPVSYTHLDVYKRQIWGETGKPGYGLFDRALGATYINGLFEACEKDRK